MEFKEKEILISECDDLSLDMIIEKASNFYDYHEGYDPSDILDFVRNLYKEELSLEGNNKEKFLFLELVKVVIKSSSLDDDEKDRFLMFVSPTVNDIIFPGLDKYIGTLPIISDRAPTTQDAGEVGMIWIDETNNDVYFLTSVSPGKVYNWRKNLNTKQK